MGNGRSAYGAAGRGAHAWRSLLTVVIAAVVTVGLGALAVTLVPPIWAAATTTTSPSDTTAALTTGESRATVVVPAGWAVRPVFADASRLSLTSPDGRMRVDLTLREDADPAVALSDASPQPLGPLEREPAGDGRELFHARSTEGDLIAGALVAPGAVVTFVSGPSPEYDAELALLLTGVEVIP